MYNRGGFHGQRPMGHNPMNQPSMNLPGMNMTGMNMSGMNMSGMNMPGMTMSGMGMSPMNQPNVNLSGMNHPGMNHQRMGHPGINHQNIGLPGMNQPNMNMNLNRMNQPNMNLNRMNHPDMNQGGGGGGGGGMGFRPEMKNPAFGGMRPMDNTGSFGGNTDPMGMKGMTMSSQMLTPSDRLMGPQGIPQRFPSPSVPLHQGQPRMPSQNQEIPSIVNRVLTHSSDHMMKPKAPLQDLAQTMKDKRWDNNPNIYGNVGQDMGMKSIPSGPPLDKVSNVQNRYTNESASSILESFGLSNEDLEELSRYPDDQLTPANMPSILRDIRLRKVVCPAPVPEQAPLRRPAGDAAIQSNVIDYGHSSKYKYNEPAKTLRSYDSPRTEQKPPPVPKVIVAPTVGKQVTTPKKGMDNKIPTISGSRKPVWSSSSKASRSNNKTLVNQDTSVPMTAAKTVPAVETPVITIKTDAPAVPEVAPPVKKELTPVVQVVAGVSQLTYQQQPAEKPAAGKDSWGSVLSQEEAQKMKKLPTPSMMNDYYAASPRIFPHICSLCNVECRHLKDWIKHQNNTPHIDSCRNLRQQYPDWNPQVLSSTSIEGKKDETTSKKSKSKSPNPRRSRRSSSRHRVRKSRSRSPRSSGRKSRSRSPRRARHSPKRSHSPPRRAARSPHRSHSPRKYKLSSRSKSPDKNAVDAAVQSFIEASKQKSGEKAKSSKATNGKKPSNVNEKSKKPGSSAAAPKKPASAASNSSSSSTKPSNSSSSLTKARGSSSAARKPSFTSSATKKAASNRSSARKPVVSSGAKKTTTSSSSGKKPQPVKQSAQKAPHDSSSSLLYKYMSKSNVDQIIHVTNLPDSGYTDKDILKLVQPFGKVSDILIVRSKNEAFLETSFKETAVAAVKYNESAPVKLNNKQITLSLVSQIKKFAKISQLYGAANPVLADTSAPPAETGSSDKTSTSKANVKETKASSVKEDPPKKEEPVKKLPEKEDPVKKLPEKEDPVKKLPEKEDQVKLWEKEDPVRRMLEKYNYKIEAPPGFVKCYMLDGPPLKEQDRCVVLISNLPGTQYTVDEITNLAKPFGGVNDVLIIATHNKAYLELGSRNSVDSMLKFYTVFPTYLSGNLLSISIATRYKDVKNEDLIFADLIEQDSYKITPSIYETFVHLTDLPEKDVEDFEITRVGLRFGRVEHHVFFSNKKKAIIHMHSASAAKAMHSFLSQYPCNIGDNVIKCSLPPQMTLAEDEYRTYIEEDKQSQKVNTEKPKAPESKKAPDSKEAPESKKALESKEPTESRDPTESKETLESRKPTECKESTESKEALESGEPTECKDPTESGEPTECRGPTEAEEKPSASEDKESEDESVPPSPVSDAEMEVDSTEIEEESTPAPPANDEEETDPTSDQVLAQPTSCYIMVATDDNNDDDDEEEDDCNKNDDYHDDDDDEEEAAEAAEAPDSAPLYVQAEPETIHPEPHLVSQPQLSSEFDVLVSVESDEEEAEELEHIPLGADEGTSDDPEAEGTGDVGNKDAGKPSTGKCQDSSSSSKVKESHLISAGKVKEAKLKTAASSNKGSKSVRGKYGEEKTKGKAEMEAPESGQGAATSGGPMLRTTKYNAQKGEISITVTMESQRAALKSVVSRKRTSRERGASSYESSNPRSNSNRSSPAGSSSSHTKSNSNFPQKKSSGKYVTSQPERDSKDRARSREKEGRSSGRKDDRVRGSTSSRYSRSSKSNNRSPRSKEEQEESFPFNLDEFVTVDEIVEEPLDPRAKAGEQKEEVKPDSARKGKRKENDPITSDTKKSRAMSGESHELSFVTLDEVGDEEESATAQETTVADQTAQALVTVDEVYAEGGPPASTKDKQILMTLDEISDEDEAQAPSAAQRSSTTPRTLNKNRLLTLHEVNEEQTAPIKSAAVEEPKLLEETKDAAVKKNDAIKEPEAKQRPDKPHPAPANGDRLEQPLVTVDEVKAEDDEEMSFDDIEHQFLTVDEIGEEEDESEIKSENKLKPDDKSKSSGTKSSEPTPPARRGRPRKRPLPETAEDSPQRAQTPDTSRGAAPSKTPTKAKPTKGSELEDGKQESADGKSGGETPAKKTKQDSAPAEKKKLAPYNSNTAVGLEFLVPKTGYFCELCSLFYMDDSSKLKHCRSLRHYQQVEKHLDKASPDHHQTTRDSDL